MLTSPLPQLKPFKDDDGDDDDDDDDDDDSQ